MSGNAIFKTVRFIGVVFGILFLLMAFADIAGLNEPSIGEMPNLFERIKSSIFILLYGLALVYPQRLIKGHIVWSLILVMQVIAFIYFINLTYEGLIDYSNGLKHIAVIPTSLTILFVVFSNIYLHFKIRKS